MKMSQRQAGQRRKKMKIEEGRHDTSTMVQDIIQEMIPKPGKEGFEFCE